MSHKLVKDARERMQKSIEAFSKELSSIRTGRASVALLDSIEVESYGSKMKVIHVAQVNAPEARLLTVTPYDRSQMAAIEKAIMASPLDLTPNNDGHVIRIPLPPLSEERRKDLVKLVSKLAEEARVSIRNIRRIMNDEVKKLQKDGNLPEDDAHRVADELQKVTDEFVQQVEEILKAKDAEIMEV
jgi:ribosome recycling factor